MFSIISLTISLFFSFQSFGGNGRGPGSTIVPNPGGVHNAPEEANKKFQQIAEIFLTGSLVGDSYSFDNSKATRGLRNECSTPYENITNVLQNAGSTKQNIVQAFETEYNHCIDTRDYR